MILPQLSLVLSSSPEVRRRGFTLVELLVVIAIIGILMALIVPAVIRALGQGTVVTTTAEMAQMETAIQTFKTTYNVDYVPSQIKLCERYGDYNQGNALDKDSINFLVQMWPKLLTPDPAGNIRWNNPGIDWNADGQIGGPVVLEGHQCLVFFLGGAVQRGTGANCVGFATDPRDPIKLGQTTSRKGPFFEFKTERLGVYAPSPAAAAGYLSYYDPYAQQSPPQSPDMPYAYFSSNGKRNGYNVNGDCPSLAAKPYFTAPGQFQNPTSQQIVSAGADRVFGTIYQWPRPAGIDLSGDKGLDNQVSFQGGLMGTGK